MKEITHVTMELLTSALVALLLVQTLPLLAGQTKAKNKQFFAELQRELQPSQTLVYKTVAGRELTLHFFHPDGFQSTDQRPAFVAIHGGGWTSGTPRRFYPYANSLVPRGLVGVSIEYRLLRQKQGNTVFDCVKDGRAAIRYLRAHAEELGIDPAKIIVSGGSAGGHVAAGTALFDGVDHADDDLTVSCVPNALVLLFPVIDTSSEGYGKARIGEKWESLSPRHQIRGKVPPTLIFHGDSDRTTPILGAREFQKRMRAKGNICELVVAPGGGHGHINQDLALFDDAVRRMEVFLRQQNLLSEKSADLTTPVMSDAAPTAGKRVRQVAPEYEGTGVYHSLYLPVDWKPDGNYPVIVEYTGNKFAPGKGSGEVKDANLGYGMSGGHGFIWVVMPYVEKGRQKNAVTWWGDKQATVDYCKVNLPRICKQFRGDPDCVFVCGFSRGAIGSSYIGLADDEIAALWLGMFTHDHFDGQKSWGYRSSDRASALTRLRRLKGRPVLICGQHASTVRDQFLAKHLDLARFTFLDVPTATIFKIPEGPYIHPHTDLWMHRDSEYRQQARAWLQGVLREKR